MKLASTSLMSVFSLTSTLHLIKLQLPEPPAFTLFKRYQVARLLSNNKRLFHVLVLLCVE